MSVAENVRNYSLIQFVVTTRKYNYQNYITSKDIIVLYIHKKIDHEKTSIKKLFGFEVLSSKYYNSSLS